ncbi:MAG: hypothetical protein ACO2PM_05155 [Pyrobaculum sp.]
MQLGVVGVLLGWPWRCGRVGRGGVLWVVGSSWWFSAFFHGGGWLWRRSSAWAAVLKVFTRLGGEGTGGIRRRVGRRPPQAVRRF